VGNKKYYARGPVSLNLKCVMSYLFLYIHVHIHTFTCIFLTSNRMNFMERSVSGILHRNFMLHLIQPGPTHGYLQRNVLSSILLVVSYVIDESALCKHYLFIYVYTFSLCVL
jgi:hypothetical protein